MVLLLTSNKALLMQIRNEIIRLFCKLSEPFVKTSAERYKGLWRTIMFADTYIQERVDPNASCPYYL